MCKPMENRNAEQPSISGPEMNIKFILWMQTVINHGFVATRAQSSFNIQYPTYQNMLLDPE